MRKSLKYLYLFLVASGSAAPAMATYPVYDPRVDQTIQRTNQYIAERLDRINGNAQETINQLKLLRNEQNSASSKMSKAISEASDNQIQRNIDVNKELRMQEAERSTRMPLDPCANAARAAAPDFDRVRPGVSSGAVSPRFGGGPKGLEPTTGSPKLDRAIQIANGAIAAPSPETQAILAQEGACDKYAAGTRAQSCANAKLKVGQVVYPNADVRAATIFNGAQKAADIDKVSLTFTEDQMAAARAYLRNVTNPVTLRELTPAEAATEEGRRYLSLRDAHAARLDLATQPVADWMTQRAEFKKTIPLLQSMLEGNGAAAAYLRKELPAVAPEWEKKGVSLHQMAEFETARRARNPEWIKEIAKANDALTLQREQLMLSAQIADQLNGLRVEAQRSNIILGMVYQASLNKDFMPEVVNQYKKATSSR